MNAATDATARRSRRERRPTRRLSEAYDSIPVDSKKDHHWHLARLAIPNSLAHPVLPSAPEKSPPIQRQTSSWHSTRSRTAQRKNQLSRTSTESNTDREQQNAAISTVGRGQKIAVAKDALPNRKLSHRPTRKRGRPPNSSVHKPASVSHSVIQAPDNSDVTHTLVGTAHSPARRPRAPPKSILSQGINGTSPDTLVTNNFDSVSPKRRRRRTAFEVQEGSTISQNSTEKEKDSDSMECAEAGCDSGSNSTRNNSSSSSPTNEIYHLNIELDQPESFSRKAFALVASETEGSSSRTSIDSPDCVKQSLPAPAFSSRALENRIPSNSATTYPAFESPSVVPAINSSALEKRLSLKSITTSPATEGPSVMPATSSPALRNRLAPESLTSAFERQSITPAIDSRAPQNRLSPQSTMTPPALEPPLAITAINSTVFKDPSSINAAFNSSSFGERLSPRPPLNAFKGQEPSKPQKESPGREERPSPTLIMQSKEIHSGLGRLPRTRPLQTNPEHDGSHFTYNTRQANVCRVNNLQKSVNRNKNSNLDPASLSLSIQRNSSKVIEPKPAPEFSFCEGLIRTPVISLSVSRNSKSTIQKEHPYGNDVGSSALGGNSGRSVEHIAATQLMRLRSEMSERKNQSHRPAVECCDEALSSGSCEFVEVTRLHSFLRENESYWINPPNVCFSSGALPLFSCPLEVDDWIRDAKTDRGSRKVMLWDSQRKCIVPFSKCPSLATLFDILDANRHYEIFSRAIMREVQTRLDNLQSAARTCPPSAECCHLDSGASTTPVIPGSNSNGESLSLNNSSSGRTRETMQDPSDTEEQPQIPRSQLSCVSTAPATSVNVEDPAAVSGVVEEVEKTSSVSPVDTSCNSGVNSHVSVKGLNSDSNESGLMSSRENNENNVFRGIGESETSSDSVIHWRGDISLPAENGFGLHGHESSANSDESDGIGMEDIRTSENRSSAALLNVVPASSCIISERRNMGITSVGDLEHEIAWISSSTESSTEGLRRSRFSLSNSSSESETAPTTGNSNDSFEFDDTLDGSIHPMLKTSVPLRLPLNASKTLRKPGRRKKLAVELRMLEKGSSSVRVGIPPRSTHLKESSLFSIWTKSKMSAMEKVTSFVPLPGRTLASLVIFKLIMRQRFHRVLHHDTSSSKKADVWNIVTRSRVRPDRSPQATELVEYLFRHNRYEEYFGQELLEGIGSSRHLELVPISGTTPSGIASFWNVKESRRVRAEELGRKATQRVADFLREHKDIVLYIGQDLDHTVTVEENRNVHDVMEEAMTRSRHRSLRLSEKHFFLACRGAGVTKLILAGWHPVMASKIFFPVTYALLWNLQSKRRVKADSAGHADSLNELLLSLGGLFEPYIGQDQCTQVQEELRAWFHILKWAPGCQGDSYIPMLVRKKQFHPAVRFPRITAEPDFHLQRSIDKTPALVPKSNVSQPPRTNKSLSTKILSQGQVRVARSDTAKNSREIAKSPIDLVDCGVSPAQVQELCRSNVEGRIPMRHKSTGIVLHKDVSPYLRDLALFLSQNREYEIDYTSGGGIGGVIFSRLSECNQLLQARLSAQREANRLQFVISALLSTSRIGDHIQKIRQEIEDLIPTSANFEILLAKLYSGIFVQHADSLLHDLESLFAKDTNDEWLSDLIPVNIVSIRERMSLGLLFSIHDVVSEFRKFTTSNVRSLEPGSVALEDAKAIYLQGEQTILSFCDAHMDIFLEDECLDRIRRLSSTGWDHLQVMGLAGEVNPTVMASLSKCFGRSEGVASLEGPLKFVSTIPYLNHRDELGYSHMGKRHSARVLGLPMDISNVNLETVSKNWSVDSCCHICGKNISSVYSNALPCSNRLFGTCSRIVCRPCLVQHQGLDTETFLTLRVSREWYCFHCTGLCEEMQRACISHVCDQLEPEEGEIYFTWKNHGAPGEKTTIEVSFARCRPNGKFDAFQTRRRRLMWDPSRCIWFCRFPMSVGQYRLKVEVNKQWFASSLIHILSKPVFTSLFKTQKLSNPFQILNATWVEPNRRDDALSFSIDEQRPKIQWQMSVSGRGSVMSLRGCPVRECSRTEGYNWRMSKRHTVLKWQPRIQGLCATEKPAFQKFSEPLAVCRAQNFSPSNHTGSPLKVGTAYRKFLEQLATFKYRKMIDHSLWGLVVCRSQIHGLGLYTVSGYSTGDFIIEYAGDLIRSPIADIREPRYEAAGLGTYFFRISDCQIVDATVQSNRARFINHCCDPNMAASVISVEGRSMVVLRAIRPIPPFSELTFNYQLPLEEKKLQCYCKSWNCVGVMN